MTYLLVFVHLRNNKIFEYVSPSHFLDGYLVVAKAPGQQLTEAQTRTPLLGPSGPACTASFDFALTGKPVHIGIIIILQFTLRSC